MIVQSSYPPPAASLTDHNTTDLDRKEDDFSLATSHSSPISTALNETFSYPGLNLGGQDEIDLLDRFFSNGREDGIF